MDFFGAQDNARRKTWRLAALFAAAVLSLILLTNLLVALVYAWTTSYAQVGPMNITGLLRNLPPSYWGWISFGVVGAVVVASLYKYLMLRGGGRTIAESLGGVPLARDGADARQKRLLNVVEEMAIASGVPVPPVYLIAEPSINAFAAGFSPDDAVIGVNQGTIDHLNRDELQGVIAHEFSHILNGDMRLNLRLMAALFGILFIGLVGRGILYGVGRSGGRRAGLGSSRRGGSGSSGGAPVLALGVGFLVIGYGGTFFGNLIKAAVSRQREFLADASSVQFTRNPEAIAGALKKIGGLSVGSTMKTAAAGEASHLFFGQIGPMFLGRWMATHPPLDARIRAVDPRWDGTYPAIVADEPSERLPEEPEAAEATAASLAGAAGMQAPALAVADTGAESLLVMADPAAVTEAVGQLTEQSLTQAVRLIHTLPDALRDAAHDPFSGRAILYGLVLDGADPEIRGQQLDHLTVQAERGVAEETIRLYPQLRELAEPPVLTLVEMAMPALKTLSHEQYRRFAGNLVTLIKMDRRIDLMEWVLHRLLVKELKPHFEGVRRLRARYGRVEDLADDAALLLATLARNAGDARRCARSGSGATASAQARHADAQHALDRGMAQLDLKTELHGGAERLRQLIETEDPNYAALSKALGRLRQLKPLQKPRLIKACAATVLADGRASGRQGALLQGIAATLDCPLPPSIYQASARAD